MTIQSPVSNLGRKSETTKQLLIHGSFNSDALLRSVSSSSKYYTSHDSYKSISEILNVTTAKADSTQSTSEDILTEQEHSRIKNAQSKSHFSGPGGATRSGLVLGIETSADDTG